jgi:hypothetical protein
MGRGRVLFRGFRQSKYVVSYLMCTAYFSKVDLHKTHTKENTQGKNYTQLLEKCAVQIR